MKHLLLVPLLAGLSAGQAGDYSPRYVENGAFGPGELLVRVAACGICGGSSVSRFLAP